MNDTPETPSGELLDLWRTAHVELPSAHRVLGNTADLIHNPLVDGFGHHHPAWSELAHLYEQATQPPH